MITRLDRIRISNRDVVIFPTTDGSVMTGTVVDASDPASLVVWLRRTNTNLVIGRKSVLAVCKYVDRESEDEEDVACAAVMAGV